MVVMKKLTTSLMMAAATLLLTISCFTLSSCEKLEDDLNGMNDSNAFYSYKSFSTDFDYQDACGGKNKFPDMRHIFPPVRHQFR